MIRRLLLVLLGLQGSVASWAQAGDAKSEVYLSYFNQTVFHYDSAAHKRIKNVFIAPLDSSMHRLDFDVQYLRDYLNGTINSNKIYQEVIQPKGQNPLSWLDYPWELHRLLIGDKQAGYLLLQLDSVLHIPHLLPAFTRNDKRFLVGTVAKPDWKQFYRQYPHSYGLAQVSDCVFSTDGKRAVFYFQVSRGGLDGWGGVIFMKHTAMGWEGDTALQFWIS